MFVVGVMPEAAGSVTAFPKNHYLHLMDKRLQAIIVVGLGGVSSAAMGARLLGVHLGLERFVNMMIFACCAVGIQLLWSTGSFHLSPLRRFLGIALAIYILSLMFQLMHWPFVPILMGVALFAMMGIYGYHFYLKPTKGTRDILRLLVVLITITMFGLIRLQWIADWHGQWTASGIVTLAALEYLLNPRDSIPDLDPEQRSPGDAPVDEDAELK